MSRRWQYALTYTIRQTIFWPLIFWPPDRAEADGLEGTHPLHTLRRLINAPLPLPAGGLPARIRGMKDTPRPPGTPNLHRKPSDRSQSWRATAISSGIGPGTVPALARYGDRVCWAGRSLPGNWGAERPLRRSGIRRERSSAQNAQFGTKLRHRVDGRDSDHNGGYRLPEPRPARTTVRHGPTVVPHAGSQTMLSLSTVGGVGPLARRSSFLIAVLASRAMPGWPVRATG